MKYCPMKFTTLGNVALKNPSIAFDEEIFNSMIQCDEKKCAWYCQYPNGQGECAIASLPGLFDGLDSIATQIATK